MAGAVPESGNQVGMGQIILALVALLSQQRTRLHKQNEHHIHSDEAIQMEIKLRGEVCDDDRPTGDLIV